MRVAILVMLLAGVAVAQKAHELCVACHTGPAEEFDTHPHKAKDISCDACHGASVKHREAQGQTPPDRIAGPLEVPALCGACHTGQLAAYKPSRHYEALMARVAGKRAPNCVTCHSTHAPRAAAAMETQCKRCHEMLPAACKPAGCASCHDPHTGKRK